MFWDGTGTTGYRYPPNRVPCGRYRALADQGHAKAQYNLGVMYGKGRGIPKDYVQAPTWYNLAASRFAPGSSRDKAVKNRAALAERMTPAQSAEAQRLAREWQPKPE